MAKRNGGIIGPDNVPAGPLGAAGGVWRLEDAFLAQKNGTWPVPLGYQVPNSLRFNSGSTDYLSRTPASTTNRRTFTFSGWVKRGNSGVDTTILGTSDTTSALYNLFAIRFTSADEFRVSQSDNIGGVALGGSTNALYRDPSAWYHIVVAIDTTQASSSNGFKCYINGSQVTFQSVGYTQNLDTSINSTSFANYIGRSSSISPQRYFSGYQSEVYFIDGQQLTPSSFGETDSTTGIWIPKAYTGTYGTNGFYLKFANSAALGTDSSGNGNTFTVNNLTSVDQSTDSPTNNFATLNSVLYTTLLTFSEGNLKSTNSSTGSQRMVASTIAPTTGKWYAECRVTSLGGAYPQIGVFDMSIYTFDTYTGALARGYGYASHGQVYNNAGALTTGLPTYTANDIIGVALDLDNNYVYFSKNGTFINSGVPTSGSSGTGGWAITNGYDYAFSNSSLDSGTDPVFDWNFGSPFYSANSYADANGFGNFSYAVPSGYYSLCSKNLALYG
jgi:hypothetical protein